MKVTIQQIVDRQKDAVEVTTFLTDQFHHGEEEDKRQLYELKVKANRIVDFLNSLMSAEVTVKG
jgi:hypothetical protein